MKKFLVLFFILSSGLLTRSQTYIPFPGNMIVYSMTRTQTSLGWTWTNYRYEIVGDTVLGSYHYSKIYHGLYPGSATEGLRNDTINKRVYLYSFSSGTESLLYDFGLDVGDTVNTMNGYGFYPSLTGIYPVGSGTRIDTAWVTSTDSVLMPHDGLYHRRLNFSGIYHHIYTDSTVVINSSSQGPYSVGWATITVKVEPLIEGVGQLLGPITEYSDFEYQWEHVANCASINGVGAPNAYYTGPPVVWGGVAMDSNLCYSIFTGIPEHAEGSSGQFRVYPNPVSGQLTLELPAGNCQILIEDILGREIAQHLNCMSTTRLDLTDLPKGIYFLRIENENRDQIVKKIIKQ